MFYIFVLFFKSCLFVFFHKLMIVHRLIFFNYFYCCCLMFLDGFGYFMLPLQSFAWFCVLTGESDPHEAFVVGGKHPNKSFVPVSDSHLLSKDDLAQVHACTIVKHVDCLGGVFQVQQVPRHRVSGTQEELSEISKLFEASTRAIGSPPLCIAMDNHGSFELAHAFFLGRLVPEVYDSLPFFAQCRPSKNKVPAKHFPFRHMIFKTEDVPLFGCNDPEHIVKAVARALRTPSRVLQLFPWL